MAQKTRQRKQDEEEQDQEQFDDEQPEGFDEESQDEDGNEVGLRLKEDAVEIDLPRDGNEGKTLHAIADMLDSIA
jgi:hypothetical protein